MYSLKLSTDRDIYNVRNNLSLMSVQSNIGQGIIPMYGREHQFSSLLQKGSEQLFIPSSVKVTKTKLYSGDLKIQYNLNYPLQNQDKGSVLFQINMANEQSFDITRVNMPTTDSNFITSQEATTEATRLINLLKKLSYKQYAAFYIQAVKNANVVKNLKNMGFPADRLPAIATDTSMSHLRCRSYTLKQLCDQSEGFSKAVNFYNSRKMQFLYVNTKLNLHPSKIEVQSVTGKSVSFRSPTIIIVEYQQQYQQQLESQLNQGIMQEVNQRAAGVVEDTTYKRKKRYQRSTLAQDVVKAIKTLQTRIFMLCPKTQLLGDLINEQGSLGAYQDLVNYYDGISSRSIASTWSKDDHDKYVAQLKQEFQAVSQGNIDTLDYTIDEYPIAKIPHFEFISKVHVFDLFSVTQANPNPQPPTSQEYTLRRKAILYKTQYTPLLDRFKVISNGKLSTVVMRDAHQASVVSKNFNASQVMIFNGKRRKAIQTILNNNMLTSLIFSIPSLQIPFQFMGLLDVDLYQFRVCMGSSIASMADHGTGYQGLDGQAFDVSYEVAQNSTFSWIFSLFARRALRNSEFEAIRMRMNKMIFSNKLSGRLERRLNSLFYSITKFKKMSDKVLAYNADDSVVSELKFSYNPSKFMHVLFLLYPAIHQLYIGDGTTQVESISIEIVALIEKLRTADLSQQTLSVTTLYANILQRLSYITMVQGDFNNRIKILDDLRNRLQKDTIISTLVVKLVGITNVQTTLVGKNGFDVGTLIAYRTKLLSYILHRWLAEYIEFMETLTILIHFYAEKKFKNISDTNIHTLIVYFAQLATIFMQTRLQEFGTLQAFDNQNIEVTRIGVGLTLLDIETFLFKLIDNYIGLIQYIPRPRAHKAKYTKYLVFDPDVTAGTTRVGHYVFDSQKWQILNTASICKELLKNHGRISDIRVNIWSDDASKFMPQGMQFSKLVQNVDAQNARIQTILDQLSRVRQPLIQAAGNVNEPGQIPMGQEGPRIFMPDQQMVEQNAFIEDIANRSVLQLRGNQPMVRQQIRQLSQLPGPGLQSRQRVDNQ